MEGQLGMNNMSVSLPCIVGAGGREKVLEIPMSPEEEAGVKNSHRVLRETADGVGLK
jgi:malate/lactate dehydrogenase